MLHGCTGRLHRGRLYCPNYSGRFKELYGTVVRTASHKYTYRAYIYTNMYTPTPHQNQHWSTPRRKLHYMSTNTNKTEAKELHAQALHTARGHRGELHGKLGVEVALRSSCVSSFMQISPSSIVFFIAHCCCL